jgi:hypothetical protein
MPSNIGSQADPAVTDPTADATVTALLKGLLATLAAKAGASGNVHEPAANTAAVVAKAAGGAGVSNVLALVAWSYDGDPTAGSLIIADGASTVFKVDITAAGPGFFTFAPPLKGTANTALVATLAAGGSGVSGIVSLHTWTE